MSDEKPRPCGPIHSVKHCCEFHEQEEAARHNLDVEAASQISLFNFCGITAKDGRVLQLLSHGGTLDPEDALRVAAWLIVGAELAGQERAAELTACLVARIRSI